MSKNIYKDNCLDYLNAGYSVIPDGYMKKRPLIKGWQNFCTVQPSNGEVENWGNSFRESNIAVCLGEASGIVALDLDCIDPEILEVLEPLLPPSPCEKRGSKGYTRFFQYRNESTTIIKANGKVVLELLSKGKKTTIPPSIHPEGHAYAWVGKTLLDVSKNELPILPPALFAHLEMVLQKCEMNVYDHKKVITGRTLALGAKASEYIASQKDLSSAVSDLIKYDADNHDKPLFTDPIENQGISNAYLNALKFYSDYLKSINVKRIKEGKNPELPFTAISKTKPFNAPSLEQSTLEELPEPTGLLKDISDYILARSYVEQPVFAISAAMSLIGTLASRKITFQGSTPNTYLLNVAESGCVDNITEYMSPTGWKPISEYNGEKVLSWDKKGNTKFDTPLKYIKNPQTNFIKFKSKNMDMMLSGNHRVAYTTREGIDNIISAEELYNRVENSPNGKTHYLLPFNYNAPKRKGIDLTDQQLKVMVAFIADGAIPKSGNGAPNTFQRISIKKQCKKDRLRMLLQDANIEYRESCTQSAPGFTRFYFKAPIVTKTYKDFWVCNDKQLDIIAGEVHHWDGALSKQNKTIFRTGVKENADFVQHALQTSRDTYVSLSFTDRRGQPKIGSNGKTYIHKSIEYIVRETTYKTIGFSKNGTFETEKVQASDGYEYCFTMPNENWIMRRNGKICLTKNSGKNSCQESIKDLLRAIKAEGLLGATTYPSEASIISNLSSNPVRLDIIDEASSFLKNSGGLGASYAVGIGDTLCELFSCSNSKYLGKVLASVNGAKVGECDRPHLNLLCSTTYKGMSEGLSRATLEKGLFARFLVFFGDNSKRGKRVTEMPSINTDMKERLEYIHAFTNPLVQGNLKGNIPAYEIGITKEADLLLTKYHELFDIKRISETTGSITRPIVSRLYQHMMKIALVSAIGNTEVDMIPKVDVKDVEFAYKLVNFYFQSIEGFVNDNLFDSQRGHKVNTILRIIKSAGIKGIASTELTRLTKSTTLAERQEILKDLIHSAQIAVKDNNDGLGTVFTGMVS